MTGFDILAKHYANGGKLIIGSDDKLEMGKIIRTDLGGSDSDDRELIEDVLFIVRRPSAMKEYDKHLALEIKALARPLIRSEFYYEIEPAD